jgi:mono/diheme cytochrome c family protein
MNGTTIRLNIALLALVGATALTGCPPKKPKTPAAAATPATPATPAAEAKLKFETLCATCHGKTGKGDAPAAASFDVKPRDYSDAKWQGSVTDEYLSKLIVEGGAANGKSPLMPANPDLKAKPEVVKELVKIIRSFKP